jgi:hypothetical protein
MQPRTAHPCNQRGIARRKMQEHLTRTHCIGGVILQGRDKVKGHVHIYAHVTLQASDPYPNPKEHTLMHAQAVLSPSHHEVVDGVVAFAWARVPLLTLVCSAALCWGVCHIVPGRRADGAVARIILPPFKGMEEAQGVAQLMGESGAEPINPL